MLETPEERALAVQLLRFHEALDGAAAEYKPNLITAYLWDLSKAYSGFFVNCPVLKAETPALRDSRFLLCDLTARVIQLCLGFAAFLTRVAWGKEAVQPELPMVISTVAHVAVGALLLATTVVLAIQVWRHAPVAFEERVPGRERTPQAA